MKFFFEEKNARYQIILLNLIALSSTLLGIYNSNSIYFNENVFTITFFIYIAIIIVSVLLIKKQKYLLLISLFFFLDIPFIIKTEIQNCIIKLNFTSNLLKVHVSTFVLLSLILFIIYLIIVNNKKYLLYFLLFFIRFHS